MGISNLRCPVCNVEHSVLPRGPQWDSHNWSCPYDSTLCIIFNTVFHSENTSLPLIRSRVFTPTMTLLTELVSHTSSLLDHELDALRTRICMHLFEHSPRAFPLGHALASASDVFEALLTEDIAFGSVSTVCNNCALTIREDSLHFMSLFITNTDTSDTPPSTAQLLNSFQHDDTSTRRCPQCTLPMTKQRRLHTAPAFIVFEVVAEVAVTHASRVTILPSMSTVINDKVHQWNLIGIVYSGHSHFTSRYIDGNGEIWFHDGVSSGHTCIREVHGVDLSKAMGRGAHLILYQLATCDR